MARIDFAWELGAGTGHVTTLLPLAAMLKARAHDVRFLLKDIDSAGDLEGAGEFAREGAPRWVGPIVYENPLNFAEILHNFGYENASSLRELVDAWRKRLEATALVIANVAPAAHIAARTLGIPSLEISQGYHIPPPVMPTPPLRDWEPAPRVRLEEADRRIVGTINRVLAAFGARQIATIGELFSARSMLLTYPELDIYSERGPAEYYGIPETGEGVLAPRWHEGDGPRVFAYLYSYYKALPALLESLARAGARCLILCRGVDPALKREYEGSALLISETPMSVSTLLPQCDLVICHGSHQMTAQALLAGKPLLMMPTHLEQFLITRRVVRFGAGLGIAPDVDSADFGAALRDLTSQVAYSSKAREFAERYRGQDRKAALATMVQRCEAAVARQPSEE
jgi:UDP:flavonoid glycosyltransferase YjiC (YdhE family)